MNQKTARMLRRYYELVEDTMSEKELKAWWNSLTHLEKAEERKRMQAAIQKELGEEEEEKAEVQTKEPVE